MKRLFPLALVLSMSASGLAGMGISTRRWQQFRTEGLFLGVFRDFRGPRAAFFVEDKTRLLIGPLDLDAPNGPGWALPPGPEPRDLAPGDHVAIVYAGIVQADRPFGHPPGDDLSKSRQDRVSAKGPLEGMFVSAEKKGPPSAIVTTDPLALALLGRAPPLTSEEDRDKAALGFLLKKNAAEFRAARPNPEMAHVGALIFDGLAGMTGPLAPVAKLWMKGNKMEAATELARTKLPFWIASDRWRRPPHPMESSPGAPLPGPFLRWSEYSGMETLALHYLAPEFLQFLVTELHWHEPPF